MLPEKTIREVLERYGLRIAAVSPPQTGYRSKVYTATLESKKKLNLILYKQEAGIVRRVRNANYIGNYLAEAGFPARQALDNRLIRIESSSSLTYGCVYNYLPGQTIPWEAYTMNHIKHIGATLSDMHARLSKLPCHNLPSAAEEMLTTCVAMQKYFEQPGVAKAMKHKLHIEPPQHLLKCQKILRSTDKVSDQQPLHMDFVRGNILFEPGSTDISGVLDFEKAAWGHPAMDIARTLAFLIVDCKYKDELKVRKYFLHSGYNKRGSSSFARWGLLENLLDIFLLYDFYKFLRHNPYESLSLNEHFGRTKNLLIRRGVLVTR